MSSAADFDTEAILAKLQDVGTAYAQKQPGAREQLMNLSHALISKLELPSEAIQRMGWAEPARAAHCRIAVDLKLFEYLRDSGTEGLSGGDLAVKSGADAALIARIMKHLAAMNIVGERDDGVYVATPLSDALTEPRYRDGIVYTYDVAGPSFRSLPAYLKSIKYTHPTELTNGPFQFAHHTALPFFAWLDQNPPYLDAFNSYMSAYRAGKPSWADPGFYPVAELARGFDPSAVSGGGGGGVFLVDVGGGLGHDLRELKSKHPALPGKLVLQDREEVISSTLLSTDDTAACFEATVHDFFTPQPVRGARAYYLHSVLHDWGDEDCVRILENLRPALRRRSGGQGGYSKVLINEIVVPDTKKATWPVTAMDQLVFVLGAMRERSEGDWRRLLERAGLRVVRVYGFEMGSESLIEADLA
ncbi:putative O-methyltransferase [Xylariomycetidae sp. FL2044]|nr:putative O-methyltransferase [Xylariomycetidae sp. FL2044]